MVIASWKRVMTRGTYNLMLKRLSLCLSQARVRSCQGPDPTIVETIRSLSESRLQWTRIRTCRRLRTKDERSHSEANRIHGDQGSYCSRDTSTTVIGLDHAERPRCLIVLRRTISYSRHESLIVLQGSPTFCLPKSRTATPSAWDFMDGHDRSDRV
jgi:hypothetical protein